MMLTIGKPTEYAPDGMAVLGQTDLDKPGWRLRYFNRGVEAEIYRGSFAMCRRIQEAADNIPRSNDEVAWVAAMCELAAKLSGRSYRSHEVTLSEPTAAYTYDSDCESSQPED